MIENLAQFDRAFFLFLNSFHHPWLDPVMTFLSGQMVWAPLIGYFLWLSLKQLGKRGSIYFLLFMFLALAASDVTSSYILKNLFNRLRPCREEEILPLLHLFGQKCGGKYGFVSSHAANSICIIAFSFLALFQRPKFFHAAWLAPVLVSISRIYLGVHYPGDILGGLMVGCLWGIIFGSAFRSYQGAKR